MRRPSSSAVFLVCALVAWIAVTLGTGYFGLVQPWGYVLQIADGGLIGIASGAIR